MGNTVFKDFATSCKTFINELLFFSKSEESWFQGDLNQEPSVVFIEERPVERQFFIIRNESPVKRLVHDAEARLKECLKCGRTSCKPCQKQRNAPKGRMAAFFALYA